MSRDLVASPLWDLLDAPILHGNALARLRQLPSESVQTCVTSPPYWGLRDYGTATWEGGDPDCEHRTGGQVPDGKAKGAIKSGVRPGVDSSVCLDCGAVRVDEQLGLEPTPEEYVEKLVAIFDEVARVLRRDGTLWLNLGDSYASKARGSDKGWESSRLTNPATVQKAQSAALRSTGQRHRGKESGLKEKDLVGIPWMVAFALRSAGWYLRKDIIWSKPNPMPESVTDRPSSTHEYIFLLSRSPRYFYDHVAIQEEAKDWTTGGPGLGIKKTDHYISNNGGNGGLAALAQRYRDGGGSPMKNKRSVWDIATQPYAGAHFATFPPALIRPCILAGTPPRACGVCGAPWQRIVEPTGRLIKQQNGGPGTVRRHEEAKGRHGATSSLSTGFKQERATVGWEPTCEHEDGSGSSVVLDPFTGAATTALVAIQHGRDFLGIELNADYIDLGMERIARYEANPSGSLEGDPEPIEGQLGLDFDTTTPDKETING